jgi:molybdopterin-containing oxidoreductase family membrane subunit
MTLFGSVGLFVTLFFLFIRVLPMISIFEVHTLLPAANPTSPAPGIAPGKAEAH